MYFNFIMPRWHYLGTDLVGGRVFRWDGRCGYQWNIAVGKKGLPIRMRNGSVSLDPQVWKRWVLAFIGAIILEFAAGIAGGCTSGLAISGGMLLAPAAFLFIMGCLLLAFSRRSSSTAIDIRTARRLHMNFVLALVFGAFFGFSLNKAGLTKYHKIVNVFRFTDMAVLKFMMTALVVAMSGLFALRGLVWLRSRQFLQRISLATSWAD